MRTEAELDVVDPLAAGREALSRGEWEQALAYFEAASERHRSAEAIEAVAMAAWWLDNAQLAIESRQHAYRLYRERGDAAAAARMAIWLGWDSLAFRGEPAVARGWLQRAHRLLEGGDPASAEATSVLTARELDVLKLVAQGLSNTEIAQRLVLSEHTVHRHLSNILRKLDLSPRAAAAAWGTRAGLI